MMQGKTPFVHDFVSQLVFLYRPLASAWFLKDRALVNFVSLLCAGFEKAFKMTGWHFG